VWRLGRVSLVGAPKDEAMLRSEMLRDAMWAIPKYVYEKPYYELARGSAVPNSMIVAPDVHD